jgi:hypothetical protein
MPFDAAQMEAKVDAVNAAYLARQQARAAYDAAKGAMDAADVAFNEAKAAAMSEMNRQAGVGQFS